MCQHRTTGNEKRLPCIAGSAWRLLHLFEGTQADAMVLFMWQHHIIGMVRCIDQCLESILSRHSAMAGKDVLNLSPALNSRHGRLWDTKIVE